VFLVKMDKIPVLLIIHIGTSDITGFVLVFLFCFYDAAIKATYLDFRHLVLRSIIYSGPRYDRRSPVGELE
jgi:hypothetical protein